MSNDTIETSGQRKARLWREKQLALGALQREVNQSLKKQSKRNVKRAVDDLPEADYYGASE